MPATNRRCFLTLLRIVVLLVMTLVPITLVAGQVPTVCHNELSDWIKAGKPLSIVDIQDADGFHAHNYDHALATGNDPVRLKAVARALKSTKGKVIVVSSTGGPDALQASEQLVLGGLRRARILVLEGGMEAAARNAACECCLPSTLPGAKK